MSGGDSVLFAQGNGVLTITLNEPDNRNALTPGIEHGLLEGIRIAQDDTVRSVVLTANGSAFCAGGNMSEMAGNNDLTLPQQRARTRALPDQLLIPLAELEKPVIAGINGWVVGAGMGIALAADFRIASTKAKFLLAFGRVGLVPDLATIWSLSRLVGYRSTRDLLFGSDPIDAQTAQAMGLVDEVVEPEALAGRLAERAAELAQGPTLALGLAKRLLLDSYSLDLAGFLQRETSLQGVLLNSQDYAEGRLAFREKRDPKFNGR